MWQAAYNATRNATTAVGVTVVPDARLFLVVLVLAEGTSAEVRRNLTVSDLSPEPPA